MSEGINDLIKKLDNLRHLDNISVSDLKEIKRMDIEIVINLNELNVKDVELFEQIFKRYL